MATRDYARRARRRGAEITVYNFPSSAVTENPTALRGLFAHLYNKNIRYFYQWIVNWWGPECGYSGDVHRPASIVRLVNGKVCSTQRMEAAGSGIEDYEYAVRLRKTADRLAKSNPEAAKQAEALLEKMKRLAWSSDHDEIVFKHRCINFYINKFQIPSPTLRGVAKRPLILADMTFLTRLRSSEIPPLIVLAA